MFLHLPRECSPSGIVLWTDAKIHHMQNQLEIVPMKWWITAIIYVDAKRFSTALKYLLEAECQICH